MAEFSTRKITPTDAVKIPAVNENLANPSGYVEADDFKTYATEGVAADISGIRGTDDAYDPENTTYAVGDPCIQDNVVYLAKEAITAPAGTFDPTKWDESSLASLLAGVKTNSAAITSLSSDLSALSGIVPKIVYRSEDSASYTFSEGHDNMFLVLCKSRNSDSYAVYLVLDRNALLRVNTIGNNSLTYSVSSKTMTVSGASDINMSVVKMW